MNSKRLRILVVGKGAREHAIAQALSNSPSVLKVWVVPGNDGMILSRNVDPPKIERIRVENEFDVDSIVQMAIQKKINLVVIGPEQVLSLGLANALEICKIPVFGPRKEAALLETSKVFGKQFSVKYGIPVAPHQVTQSLSVAEEILNFTTGPWVVKADGLCSGKGSLIAHSKEEALSICREMLIEKIFGKAGETLLIESCLSGKEVSVHVITDGTKWELLPFVCDYKKLYEGNIGPNTGGMGAYANPSWLSPFIKTRIQEQIIQPTMNGLTQENIPFIGVLYFGILVDKNLNPYLLEYNVRFGDPECQVLMHTYAGDLATLFLSTALGNLEPSAVQWNFEEQPTAIVLASRNYPYGQSSPTPIMGFEKLDTSTSIYFANIQIQDNQMEATSGRIATIVAKKSNILKEISKISFDGMQFRKDIGSDDPIVDISNP